MFHTTDVTRLILDYFLTGPIPATTLSVSYNWPLVGFSYVMAALASYVALDMAVNLARQEDHQLFTSRFWQFGGALALGIGIWSMHFIGMMATNVTDHLHHDLGLTAISLLISLSSSLLAFTVIRNSALSLKTIVMLAPVLGMGVAGMHYTGMMAMQVGSLGMVAIRYTPALFTLSCFIALGAAFGALFFLRMAARAVFRGRCRCRTISAALIGGAICAMHYTAMAGTVFLPLQDIEVVMAHHGDNHVFYMGASVIVAALAILGLGLAASSINQRVIASFEDTIRARTSELEVASRAKSDFLATMSHELRTPLNSIIGMNDLLLSRKNDSETKSMLDIMRLSSNNLLSIVNDILDISKIEAGKLELESIAFSPYEVLTRTVMPMLPLASARNLLLSKDLRLSADLRVLGDPTRFGRIITNLLSNAIKYTEKGSVRLDVYAKSEFDNVTRLIIRVVDTGIGIPPEKLSRVFDKFEQADLSATRKYGGTGLGLAITRELVEMMGGEIDVTSAMGAGSVFTVSIPFQIATAQSKVSCGFGCGPEVAERAARPRTLPAETRVLLAEDHELNRIYMQKLLQHMGLTRLHMVEDGQQVLDALAKEKFDLVLMDCHMPVLNGYDATAALRLREKKTGGHVPIIALTASALPGERERCLSFGMDEYLSKPVRREELLKMLSFWVAFPQEGEGGDVLDLSAIRSFSGGDRATERQFAEVFLTETQKHLTALGAERTTGENQQWSELAHLIKGGAGAMGALRLRALCAEAQDLKIASAGERYALYERIEAAFEESVRELVRLGLAGEEQAGPQKHAEGGLHA